MTEYVYLVGAEQIQQAASTMAAAAHATQSAAASIAFALGQHRAFLDEWLARFDEVLSKVAALPPEGEEGKP